MSCFSPYYVSEQIWLQIMLEKRIKNIQKHIKKYNFLMMRIIIVFLLLRKLNNAINLNSLSTTYSSYITNQFTHEVLCAFSLSPWH